MSLFQPSSHAEGCLDGFRFIAEHIRRDSRNSSVTIFFMAQLDKTLNALFMRAFLFKLSHLSSIEPFWGPRDLHLGLFPEKPETDERYRVLPTQRRREHPLAANALVG